MAEYLFKIDENNCGPRLDVFLAQNLENETTRSFVKKLVEGNAVAVNNKHVKAHYKVSEGDEIRVQISDEDYGNTALKPEDIPLDIFYEDDSLVVVNKPIGMLVHPVHGRSSGTLVNALLFHFEKLSDINSSFRPGIVHRLDRETSGLLLVAKDNRTHVRLSRQFEKHRIKKKYVAVVRGDVNFDEGIIDAPLGRHYSKWDKRAVSYDSSAKEARTFYKVLKRFSGKATLVALFPESGRTHQLRVHMAHLRHPILGDDKYGNRDSFFRMALHAQTIKIKHPENNQFVEFSSPIPEEFLNFE